MANPFRRASKVQLKLRMALIGPAGSGKTYSALNIGQHLGEKIAVVDTEHGSASKYAGLFAFDVLELESFHPQMYIDAISAAEQAGYDVLIIDSLSHAWMGKDGALELVDRAAKRSPSGNSFVAWRDVTPLHNKLIEAMLAAKLHLIVTMRSKTEYVQDKDDKGRTVIRKVGLQPVQRDGLEYEFDVVADLDTDNTLIVGKTRCPQLTGAVLPKPGKDIAGMLKGWLTDGDIPEEAPRPAQAAAKPQAATKPQRPQSGGGQPATVTDAQRKRLFAIANEHQVPNVVVKEYLASKHGLKSSKELNREQYDDVCAWLESQGQAGKDDYMNIDIGDGLPDADETFGDTATLPL